MDDQANVRLVHAHAETLGRHHDAFSISHEVALFGLAGDGLSGHTVTVIVGIVGVSLTRRCLVIKGSMIHGDGVAKLLGQVASERGDASADHSDVFWLRVTAWRTEVSRPFRRTTSVWHEDNG